MPIFEIQFTSKVEGNALAGQGRKDNPVKESFILVEADDESLALSMAMGRSDVKNGIQGSVTNIQIRPNTKYAQIILGE